MLPIVSLYEQTRALLQGRVEPILCNKPTLVHISHVLEDIVLKNRLPALMFTGFQRSSHWAVETARYQALADVARQVCIFVGKPLPPESPASVMQVALEDGDPLLQEWFVLILSQTFSVLLTGQDTSSAQTTDELPEFETLISFEPDVIDTVCRHLEGVLRHYRPELVPTLREAVAAYQVSYVPNPHYLTSVVGESFRFQLSLNRQIAEAERRNRQVTQRLIQERYLQGLVLEMSPSFIVLTDPEGRIVIASKSTADLVNMTPKDMEGQLLGRLYIAEDVHDRLLKEMSEAFSRGDEFFTQFSVQLPDRTIETEWRYRLLRDPDGNPQYVLGIGNDISDRIRVQEMLREQDNLRISLEKEREMLDVRSVFMTTVSHEFRTPLATILTSTELLRHHLERYSPDDIQARLERIRQQVLHLNKMLDDIADVMEAEVKEGRLAPTWLDLKTYLGLLAEDVHAAYRRTHRLVFDHEGWQWGQIFADPYLLRRIVVNLLSNAMKFSPGGSVVRLQLLAEDEAFVLKVSDQGIGIPKEDQKRLFTPFYRGSNVGAVGGTGLGLRIVADAVRDYGGTLTYATSSEGTTFTVRLPLLEP